MIQDYILRVKNWVEKRMEYIWSASIVFFGVLLLVGLWQLFGLYQNKIPIAFSESYSKKEVGEASLETYLPGVVFASKNGSRYYFPWCKSIVKDKNKVWFEDVTKAESAGYSIAQGCDEP